MADRELQVLKKEIELIREEINTYIEYPDIFRDELLEASKKIDILINKYMYLNK
ncbi:aspartyl-phosphate phosphatase Spo0E family protein [Asaccharospora irregularis]|uniref:aspartyl-phosphate phosphatase Spo0E family protein n=1 Tax=Asaccharospora irregularis TaxID=29359 RepID=UPI000934E710|nr:aspartyl-phosphate phosphatase Spo0E family protein [Asaccharospora irregularis]